MRHRTRLATSAAALAIAGLLAGCTGSDDGLGRTHRGLPTPLPSAQESGLSVGKPAVLWLDDTRFALVTWGSSSCPRAVAALDVVSDHAIQIRLKPTGTHRPCTADLAATTHELSLPAEVTKRPITVKLSYSDWDGTTELTLD